jgi:CDP-glycerol glycerophosphotransferase (TagB/SpsB family)
MSEAGRLPRNPRVAAFATHPFQLRGLRPVAGAFELSLETDSLATLEAWAPDIVLANDAGSFPALRAYCDRHFAFLVGSRHGLANKYIGPDPEFSLTDYFCGSEWDRDDLTRHGALPLREFLLTGNPWIDDVFGVRPRRPDRLRPAILFAPTWNPETSAAAFFDTNLTDAIRAVYPSSQIIIKPHPLLVTPRHQSVSRDPEQARLFGRWVDSYRHAAEQDVRVRFVDDPAISIASLYEDADILISDGSSLVFEFMALERPILLYTSDRRPAHWSAPWDPSAPANGMRDVGDEFRSREEFEAALRFAFDRHEQVHRARQQHRTSVMYGSYRDGRSAERVAAALRDLRVLDIHLDARRLAPQFLDDLQRTVRNSRVRVGTRSLRDSGGSGGVVLRPTLQDRLTDAHFLAYASRSASQASGSFAAPRATRTEVSFMGCARPIDQNWVRVDGTIGIRVATNVCGPVWQHHAVMAVTLAQDPSVSATITIDDPSGQRTCQTLTAASTTEFLDVVDLRLNPTVFTVATTTAGLTRCGERRIVSTEELVRRPEHARLLEERERREAGRWKDVSERLVEEKASGDGRADDRVAAVLRSLVPWLIVDLRLRSVDRVAIFGAGSHSRRLLDVWARHHGPSVATVVTSNASAAGDTFDGIPLVSIDSLSPYDVDAIVLSSANHEREMSLNAALAAPELPVYGLWHTSDLTGPTTDLDRSAYFLRRFIPFMVHDCRRRGPRGLILDGTVEERALASSIWRAWDGPELLPHNADAPRLWCSITAPPPSTAAHVMPLNEPVEDGLMASVLRTP